MKILAVIISTLVTLGLIIVLNTPLPINGSKTPRLGYFLSPQKGFWQNAEALDASFNGKFKFAGLKGIAEVYFDDRMIPHIYADNENDAFFIQGYLHARFRLWQMEFQTHAAGGRLSEIMGAKSGETDFLAIDRFFRRLGMVYAAENSLKIMEADPETKLACDAYTAGVNSYIQSLTEDQYPLEYKLLNYKPELWTNLKTALFSKYMAYDLSSYEEDFERTNAKSFFTKEQFEKLFPYQQDSLKPVIPKEYLFKNPHVHLAIPPDADSLYFNFKDSVHLPENPAKTDPGNGSNNWAVAGSKTKSGSPILCNDPHLTLNLPSVWYEMQISTPNYNVYGVSFPGSPAIPIGFNDHCAFGETNSSRDVRDYYEIKFRDSTMKEYWYNNTWRQTIFRNEVIKIKNEPDRIEKIPMTIWGPVMYDKDYPDKLNSGRAYACRWSAHDGSNEIKTFLKLNAAENFEDYEQALSGFQTPGQNFAFAAKNGDIAIKQQGKFPAKWRRQGDFLMPGDNDRYAWQGAVPDSQNIVMRNPARGYVSSANQYPYDTSYPYYLGGTYEVYRGLIINRNLKSMEQVTTNDMKQLQTDNYNVFAEMARPVLLKYLDEDQLNAEEKKYLSLYKDWNLRNDAKEIGPTLFTTWWDSLMVAVYNDEFSQTKLPLPKVEHSTLLESMLRDSASLFYDDINTPQKETIKDCILKAFRQAVGEMEIAEKKNMQEWGKFKDSGIRHILKIPALGRLHLFAGGGDHIINAYKQFHGPSWRMVVQLSEKTEAYGIYPGGQSGNPGSPYYDSFIDDYIAGKYYTISILPIQAFQSVYKAKMIFSKL